MDTLAGCETQADWRQVDRESHFCDLFGFGQQKKSIVGHNITEEVLKTPRNQHEGTAMVTMGRMSANVLDSGVDYTGLGRWSWQLIGKGDVKTRVVVAYQPSDKSLGSKGFKVFDQQARYFEARGDFRSPRTIFYEQLVAQLLSGRKRRMR